MYPKYHLDTWLSEYATAYELSQTDASKRLAKEVGVHHTTIYRWEKIKQGEKQTIAAKHRPGICAFFGKTEDQLIVREEQTALFDNKLFDRPE